MTSLPLRTTTTAWTLAFGHCAMKASSWQSLSASRPTSAWLAMVQPSFNATGAPQTFVSCADAGRQSASSASNSMRDFVIQT